MCHERLVQLSGFYDRWSYIFIYIYICIYFFDRHYKYDVCVKYVRIQCDVNTVVLSADEPVVMWWWDHMWCTIELISQICFRMMSWLSRCCITWRLILLLTYMLWGTCDMKDFIVIIYHICSDAYFVDHKEFCNRSPDIWCRLQL